MTSRERLIKVLSGELPDRVPVAPDTSNMIPARLTGLPFWDLYLYKKIPIWKAYIDCAKYFGFDSLMDGYAPILFSELSEINTEYKEAIIKQNDDAIYTRFYKTANGKRFWNNRLNVYDRVNPMVETTINKLSLPDEPGSFKDVEGVTEWPTGEELLKYVKKELGDQGLVGVTCGTSSLIGNEEAVYDYFDDPDKYVEISKERLDYFKRRFNHLMSLETKPDFIGTGASGSLVLQTIDMVKQLTLPIVKEMARLAKENGIFSHVHSCGPEAALVELFVNETDLSVIDPLEIKPMGDCNLKELKQKFGDKITLKGNLHTTEVMLFGTPNDVIEASKRAIEDAAEGGRFILSTGDQCGRDTPDANIFAMIEAVEKYGRY